MITYPSYAPPQPLDVFGGFGNAFQLGALAGGEQSARAAGGALTNFLYGGGSAAPAQQPGQMSLSALAMPYQQSSQPAGPMPASTGLVPGSHAAATGATDSALQDILNSLSGTESGGNFRAQNNEVGSGGARGHFGRLQFGQARLQDAMNAGVLPRGTTPDAFMADPSLQQRVENWHLADLNRQIDERGLSSYIGQTINGTPITRNGIIAAAHLGGIGGAERFLRTGGAYNPSDSYGTSLLDYASRHGGAGTALEAANAMAGAPAPNASGFMPSAPAGAGPSIPGFTPLTNPPPAGQDIVRPPREVMEAMFRSADTRPLAIQMAQQMMGGGEGVSRFQTFMRDDGSLWQMDVSTGQMERLQAPGEGQFTLGANDVRLGPGGQVIAEGRQPEVRPMTQDERSVWGIPADDPTPYYLDNGVPTPLTAGPLVVVDNGMDESQYDETVGAGYGNRFLDMQDAATTAQSALNSLTIMEQAMGQPGFYSGFGADQVQQLRSLGRTLGLTDAEGIDSMETFNAQAKAAALEAMGGSLGTGFSNADRDFVLDQVPQLSNTPEGNAALIRVQRAIAQRRIEVANLARQYAAENNGRIDPSFDDYLARWAEANPLFPEGSIFVTPTATQTQAPASPSGGYQEGQTATNPQTGERVILRNGQWEPL